MNDTPDDGDLDHASVERSGVPAWVVLVAAGVVGVLGLAVMFAVYWFTARATDRETPRADLNSHETAQPVQQRLILPMSQMPRENRADIESLYDFYWNQIPFRTHPLEGKRILCKAQNWNVGERDGDKLPAVSFYSNKGFLQPKAVIRLVDDHGWRAGDLSGTIYYEGVLRGPVELKGSSWAKPWAGLQPRDTAGFMTGYAVLIDDARIVAEPK